MYRIVVFGLVLVLGCNSPEDANKKLLDAIQGDWKIVGGDEAPDEVVKTRTFHFKGNEMLATDDGLKPDDKSAKLIVDGTKKPAYFDWISPENGQTFKGIVQVEGERMSLCFRIDSSAPRPAEFKKADKTIWVELQRKR